MNRNEIIKKLRDFKDSSREKYNILRIGIFGSAARGNMNDRSDIDVVVETDQQDLFRGCLKISISRPEFFCPIPETVDSG